MEKGSTILVLLSLTYRSVMCSLHCYNMTGIDYGIHYYVILVGDRFYRSKIHCGLETFQILLELNDVYIEVMLPFVNHIPVSLVGVGILDGDRLSDVYSRKSDEQVKVHL